MYHNIYENETDIKIKNTMLEKVTAPVNKMQGTLIYDAISPVSNELAKMYIELNGLYLKTFIENLYENYLDMRANEYGLTRKEAVKSVGYIKIFGVDNTSIPKGFLVSTSNNLQFKTIEPVLIVNGYATVKVESYEAGAMYNVDLGTINKIVTYLEGVQTVTNTTETMGGADEESDGALKERLLDRIKHPGTSGNIHHYKQWAVAVDGCGDAKVIPIWDGAGTVKVIIIDANKEPATIELVNEVSVNIENNRPIGADVTVVSAINKLIDISANLRLNNLVAIETIKTNIETEIEKYFKDIAFKSEYVSIARIGAIILSIYGVEDYDNLKINNGISDITLANNEVAKLGEVIVSA